MLRPYRQLLAIPHLTSLLVWSILARLHDTGVAIAVTFLVADWTDSYAIAGLVIGAMTIGTGISGPWRGRMADRKPVRRLLLTCALAYATGLFVLLSLPGWAWPAALVVGFLTGLSSPPAMQVGRAAFARIATPEVRTAVFAVESTLFELSFMAGPVLTAFAVGLLSPRVAVGLIAVTALVCTGGFVLALRRAGIGAPTALPTPAEGEKRAPVLAARGLASMLGASLILAMAATMIDLTIVALGRELDRPTLAGALVAVWAGGSLVGGLIFGGLSGPPRYPLRMAMLGVGIALLIPALPPVSATASPVLIGVLLAVGGLAIAPTLSSTNLRIG